MILSAFLNAKLGKSVYISEYLLKIFLLFLSRKVNKRQGKTIFPHLLNLFKELGVTFCLDTKSNQKNQGLLKIC